MKKLLIPIVALLAFSVLNTSVLAPNGLYAIRFYGSAHGRCWVYEDPYYDGEYPGEGRIHISGVAIGEQDDTYYYYSEEIRTRRAIMKVSYEYARFVVYLWSYEGPVDEIYGDFYDYNYDDWFYMWLPFSGYYFADTKGPTYFSGWAWMYFTSGYVWVELWEEGYPTFGFEWYDAWARVSAWPMEYPWD